MSVICTYKHWVLLLWLRTSQPWSGAGCLRQCWFAWAQCAAEVSTGHPNLTWAAGACRHHLSQGALLCRNLLLVLHLTDQAGWEMFQQNSFSSEFADIQEWKHVRDVSTSLRF